MRPAYTRISGNVAQYWKILDNPGVFAKDVTARKTPSSGLKAERCDPLVLTVSINNETFRPARLFIYYSIATYFGPLFGPSSRCRLINFKRDR